MTLTKESVHTLLKGVKDPEIPVISVIDLGIVQNIQVHDNKVEVDLVPTFAGCPAIHMMKNDIEKACLAAGADSVEVHIKVNEKWSTNCLSKEGKAKLKGFGISPPPEVKEEVTMELLEHAECPICNSTNTVLRSPFGPTACRAIHFCNNCNETFEQMKPL
jgi:ring-1,2-phenylacetyl-CoA epoxidase subunit PaaD